MSQLLLDQLVCAFQLQLLLLLALQPVEVLFRHRLLVRLQALQGLDLHSRCPQFELQVAPLDLVLRDLLQKLEILNFRNASLPSPGDPPAISRAFND